MVVAAGLGRDGAVHPLHLLGELVGVDVDGHQASLSSVGVTPPANRAPARALNGPRDEPRRRLEAGERGEPLPPGEPAGGLGRMAVMPSDVYSSSSSVVTTGTGLASTSLTGELSSTYVQSSRTCGSLAAGALTIAFARIPL